MNKLRRKFELKYIPGEPPTPPTPPTCVQVAKQVSVTSGSSMGVQYPSAVYKNDGTGVRYYPVYGQVEDPLAPGGYTTGVVDYIPIRDSGSSSTTTQYETVYETQCTGGSPGSPGTPGTVERVDAGPDWRASAQSIERRAGDLVASFFVPDEPRVAVGLATGDTGAAFYDLKMGVLLRPVGISVEVVPLLNGVEGTSVGYYTAGDRVTLIRAAGRFKIQVGGETLYQTAATTNDPVVLDAMLYTSNDYVDDPSFATAEVVTLSGTVGADVRLSTTTGVSGTAGVTARAGSLVDGVALVPVYGSVGVSGSASLSTSAYVQVNATMGLTGDLTALNTEAGVEATAPMLQILASDRPYAQGSVVLPSLTMEAAGGTPSVEVTGADLSIPSFGFYSRMLTGEVGTVSHTLQPLQVLAADREYAGVNLTMPALTVRADDGYMIPGYAFHVENMDIYDSITTDPSLYASIRFGLDMQPELTFGVLVSDTMLDGLILDPSLSVADFIYAMVSEGLNLSSATQGPTDIWGQYGFDLETGAATRYDNFEFDGFAYSPEATYAYRRDGVYLLRAGDDDGAPRNAMIDFGTTDFGTNAKKHIETAYIGLSTDGTVYLRLNADGRGDRTYRVIQRDPLMRAKVARGITARQWHAKLEIIDERSSELDGVEFHVAASVRRWIK